MSRGRWIGALALSAFVLASGFATAEGLTSTTPANEGTRLPEVADVAHFTLPDLLALLGGPETRAAESRPAAASTTLVPADGFVAPPPEAVTLGALVAAALAALGWAWPLVKHAAAARFYAHVRPSEVFDNEVRERIFSYVKAEPGVSATDISKRAGVSWGTTIYHLEVLEQTRMVVSLRNGRYRRYFENGAGDAAKRAAVAVLRNDVTARVAKALAAEPGLSQKDAARTVGLSPQALHWHITRLANAGLLRRERDGRIVRHFVEDRPQG